MSKMDGLRAMREARYAEATARAAQASGAKPAKASGTTKPAAAAKRAEPAAAPEAAPVDAGLCGHRNISGRTCTREKGHAATSHRYS